MYKIEEIGNKFKCKFTNFVSHRKTKDITRVLTEEFLLYSIKEDTLITMAEALDDYFDEDPGVESGASLGLIRTDSYRDQYTKRSIIGWLTGKKKEDILDTTETFNVIFNKNEYIPIRTISSGIYNHSNGNNKTLYINLYEIDQRMLKGYFGTIDNIIKVISKKENFINNKIIITEFDKFIPEEKGQKNV